MAKDDVLTIEDVLKEAGRYLIEDDDAYIRRAYDFAEQAHKDQYRKSGEAYIIHTIQVAGILVELEMDQETSAGAVLHDVVEDTEVSIDAIEIEFNHEAGMLVDDDTKLCKMKYKSKEAQQAENNRKMVVA